MRLLPNSNRQIALTTGFLQLKVATPPIPFRPRGFAPPRRFIPHSGCKRCRLLPIIGFIAFHGSFDPILCRVGFPSQSVTEHVDSNSRNAVHPSKDSAFGQHRLISRCRKTSAIYPLAVKNSRLIQLATAVLPLPLSAGSIGIPPLRGFHPTQG